MDNQTFGEKHSTREEAKTQHVKKDKGGRRKSICCRQRLDEMKPERWEKALQVQAKEEQGEVKEEQLEKLENCSLNYKKQHED